MGKNSLGERLKEARESKNLTRRKVCDDLNISESGLYMYETGRRNVSTEMLQTFARYYEISTDYLLGLSAKKEQQGSMFSVKETTETVPVLGTISAGRGLPAKEDVLFRMPKMFDEEFDLVVKGNSMYPEFSDHDIVLVRRQPEPDYEGQVSVVLINGNDAVVKQFYKKTDGVKLVSVNPDYENIFIDRWRWEQECEFIGVVVARITRNKKRT